MIEQRQRIRGSLLGVAVCDALGATVEFQPRGSFPPVLDLVGGGTFCLAPGQWTDDTSMTLCLAESLIHCRGFDAADQMRRYLGWYRRGEWSSRPGVCFDIGIRTARELRRFERDGQPWSPDTDRSSAPNGSLMRLAPIPLFFRASLAETIELAAQSSQTTHGGALCVDACRFYAAMIVGALNGLPKNELMSPAYLARCHEAGLGALEPEIDAIASGSYIGKSAATIRSSGYVVHSLEAALWCFWKSRSFAHGALLAANLGDDADTVAAIYGALAGAYYGAPEPAEPAAGLPCTGWMPRPVSVAFNEIERRLDADAAMSPASIPAQWINTLAMRHEIEELAGGLARGPLPPA